MNTSAETARRDKATELRRQGYSYEQIGEILRVTPDQAKQDVIVYLRECSTRVDDIETARLIELQRLDALLVTAQTKAEEGDIRAAKLALEISLERRRFLGLDAARQVHHDHTFERLPPAEKVKILEVALAEERALLPPHEEP